MMCYGYVLLVFMGGKKILFCVCYLPPAGSSRGDTSLQFFDSLISQTYWFQNLGNLFICRDFNARCGSLDENSNFGILNGRYNNHNNKNNNFTYIY